MRVSMRRGAAVCLCVLTMSSLSACGGQKSGATGASSPAAGVSATPSPTPSYPFTVGPVADAKNLGGRIQTAMKSVKTYHVVDKMTLASEKTSVSASVKMVADVDRSDPAAQKSHLTMSVAGKTIEMVSVGSKAWIKDNGAWVEGGSQQADQIKQTQTITKWGDALKSAKYMGEDAIGHHFEATVDPKKMLSGMDAGAAAKIGLVPADYWLDDEFKPVKIAMKFTTGGNSISSVSTLSGINQPVTIPKVA